MNNLKNKWIIYDGNCGLCLNSKRWLSKMGVIPESRCKNYHQLEEGLLEKINPGNFRYEMALVDAGRARTLYGLEAILYIFSHYVPLLSRVKPGSNLFRIIDFFYHTISFNRYFLFSKRRQFVCDCEPPLKPLYLWSWVLLGCLTAIIGTILFGWGISKSFTGSQPELILQSLVIIGTGWVIQIGIALLLMKKSHFFDYLRHLAIIMSVGVLVLTPFVLLSAFLNQWLIYGALFNVMISFGLMFKMHHHRVSVMNISQYWTLSWGLFLLACAISFLFHFNWI